MFYYKPRTKGEGRSEGVGVMKDEEIKLEEIEDSHTLGGSGEVVRGEVSVPREGVDATLLSDTLRYINLVVSDIICQVGL